MKGKLRFMIFKMTIQLIIHDSIRDVWKASDKLFLKCLQTFMLKEKSWISCMDILALKDGLKQVTVMKQKQQ